MLLFSLLELISLLILHKKKETVSVLKPDPISSGGGKKYKGRSIAYKKNHTVSNLNISLF